MAVRLFVENGQAPLDDPEPLPKVKRPTYRQDWANYNAAQVNEKDHFLDFLADLCDTILATESKRGRPSIPLSIGVYAAVFKVYSGFSARRFSCDLAEAQRRGHIGRVPHFNTVLNVLENKAVTPILYDLIHLSSLPLAAIDVDFAVDSSGFCTSRLTRWFDVKYGITRECKDWVKVHIATGVKTNVVTAVEILDQHAADVIQLPALVKATAKGFKIRDVSADMAYPSTENFQVVQDHGGTLYAPFKSNTTGGVGGIFEKAFHYFLFNRDEFLAHYHKRSNVETTFSMIKRKFGDSLRSKTDTAMVNETLAKIVCHNLCCLISALYELGIQPIFCADATCTNNRESAPILRLPRR
jgi:transposase